MPRHNVHSAADGRYMSMLSLVLYCSLGYVSPSSSALTRVVPFPNRNCCVKRGIHSVCTEHPYEARVFFSHTGGARYTYSLLSTSAAVVIRCVRLQISDLFGTQHVERDVYVTCGGDEQSQMQRSRC